MLVFKKEMQLTSNSQVKKILVWVLVLLLIIISRIINLDQTARFTQDESSDLMRMHQYFVDKTITLVGPISSDRSKVFGSLTYYMVMPFAALSNFEPIGPVWGTAFWGILTAILLIIISKKINPYLVFYAVLLIIVWYPLLETSRWAWNPHLILFWISLGILLILFKKLYLSFFAGLSLGLSFHNHYISIIATGSLVAICIIQYLLKKDFKRSFLLFFGFILAFLPFLVFDLRHPPGLFFTNYFLTKGAISVDSNNINYFSNLQETIAGSMFYLTQNTLSAAILGILIILMLISDFKTQLKNIIWFIPVLMQVLIISFLQDYQNRYFLPAVIFIFIWLILPRQKLGKLIANISLVLLIFSNLLYLPTALTVPIMPPNIYTITQASNIIANTINQQQVKNANIAILKGNDSDPLGNKYRDLLLIKHAPIRAASEYDVSENLFVISEANDTDLRQDQSIAIQYFKDSRIEETHNINGTSWKVYWFKK